MKNTTKIPVEVPFCTARIAGLCCLVLLASAYAPLLHASVQTLGDLATMINKSFSAVAKLITGASYLAGLGFSIGAIMKFKQHKDNPTQIPIGTPIALLFIAAALLFLPSILDVTSSTLFDSPRTAGPEGIAYTPNL